MMIIGTARRELKNLTTPLVRPLVNRKMVVSQESVSPTAIIGIVPRACLSRLPLLLGASQQLLLRSILALEVSLLQAMG